MRSGYHGWLLLGALFAGWAVIGSAGVAAQTLKPPPTILPVPHIPTPTPLIQPQLTPSLTPTPIVPTLTPTLPQAAPPAAMAPAATARIVRFRCEVVPQDSSCREPGAPDGGGGDADCVCGRDACYDEVEQATGRLMRVCEKLQ